MRIVALLVLVSCLHPSRSRGETEVEVPRRRHRFGAQLGGSGVFQVVYRLRAVGPLFVEAGAFGAPHGINASAGLVADVLARTRWSLYVGAGVGGATILGSTSVDGCDRSTSECEWCRPPRSASSTDARA